MSDIKRCQRGSGGSCVAGSRTGVEPWVISPGMAGRPTLRAQEYQPGGCRNSIPSTSMKTALILAAGVALGATQVHGQDKAVPELIELKAQYEMKVLLEATRPFEASLTELKAKYIAAIERTLEVAQSGGKLDEAVALKEEKAAVSGGREVPKRTK